MHYNTVLPKSLRSFNFHINIPCILRSIIFTVAEKDGTKAMALTYKDKLRLVALTRQVSYGKYRPDVTPQVGFLDVVGNDRRWVNINRSDV